MDHTTFEFIQGVANRNSGRMEIRERTLYLKAYSKANGGFSGSLIAVLVSLIILPFSIWLFYRNFVVGYAIDLETADLYKTAFGKKKNILLNLTTDIKQIHIVHNKVNGFNAGYTFSIEPQKGKIVHIITFTRPVNLESMEMVVNAVRNAS